MTLETTQKLAMALCVGRVAVGLAPFVAASATAKLLGFPADQETPTSRLFARMFGVRDAALGILVWHALPDLALLRWTFLFNLCMDAGDAISCMIPLVRRQGIDRAAASSLAFALFACTAWIAIYVASGS